MFPPVEISLRQAGPRALEQGRFQGAWLKGLGNTGLTFHGHFRLICCLYLLLLLLVIFQGIRNFKLLSVQTC